MFDKNKILTIGRIGLISLILNAATIAALAWPFEHLWNAALAPVISLPPISYLRALELGLLWRVLKGIGDGTNLGVTFRD
ncbi:MAG TPA: hypothetical protein VGG34_10570 [Opitutaceae bacterium]|jgi:hypothetical protein